MRKFIAVLIVAVVLGSGMTVSADAVNSGETRQVQRLKKEIRTLKRENAELTNAFVKQGNEFIDLKERQFPTYVVSGSTSNTVYVVTWQQRNLGTVSSVPLYSQSMADGYIATVVETDPNTVPGTVSVTVRTILP